MKKVITYGTFDLFHQGHYNILKRAKEYGDYLIVGVTSESYDIERGKLSVRDSLTKRIENVLKTGFVDEVIIEEYLGQKIRDIAKYDIDTLVIGDDWRGKFDHLKKYCNVVYLERTKNISSTQLRERSDSIYRIGIIAQKEVEDYDFISEVKYVSGLHVQSVYVDDEKYGKEFCDKYSISDFFTEFDSFVSGIDIVIVSADIENRYEYIKKCITYKKHVISKAPLTLEEAKVDELFELAKQNEVALIEDITTVYLRAFTQLLWMAKGDILGRLLSVKCTISDDKLKGKNTFIDMMTLSVAMIVKLLGINYNSVISKINSEDEWKYLNTIFVTEEAIGNVEIGRGVELENQMTIVGEKSTIVVKDDWWNTGYFEVKKYGEKFVKRYSYNFEGNGFRYILQELLIMLRDNRYICTRLFEEESRCIVKLLNTIDK